MIKEGLVVWARVDVFAWLPGVVQKPMASDSERAGAQSQTVGALTRPVELFSSSRSRRIFNFTSSFALIGFSTVIKNGFYAHDVAVACEEANRHIAKGLAPRFHYDAFVVAIVLFSA